MRLVKIDQFEIESRRVTSPDFQGILPSEPQILKFKMTEYVDQVANHIKREAQKVIAGQEAVIDQILICLLPRGML